MDNVITITTTPSDKWYQGQDPVIRALRDKPSNIQIAGIQDILDNTALIAPDQVTNYLRVFKYGRSPERVFTADYIAKLPRAADLVIPLRFDPKWPNRRGNELHFGDCWYEQPGDNSPVGSYSEGPPNADGSGTAYEKFVCNASVTLNPIYYADWSLQWGDKELRVWLRMK